MELTLKQKTAFGIGAVGKDMYMLCRLLTSCIIIRMCWAFGQLCGRRAHGCPVL